MQLPCLTDGRILRRYKRFLADVELDAGEVVTVHCPNTGTMQSCWAPGAPVQLSRSDNPKRKLAWTLERVDMGGGWIGVNTLRVNAIVAEGIAAGAIPALAGYRQMQREAPLRLPGHAASRLDLRLSQGGAPDAWVEVKNATLLDGDRVRFPDAVSERALKHLELLAALAGRGERGVILFAVNRPEGRCFSPADAIHPAYGRRLRELVRDGVEAVAVRLRHEGAVARCGEAVPVDLG